MRVLHAYICEEYYTNWSKEQLAQGLSESKDMFLRTFGTPMIVVDVHQKDEFFPVNEGGYIRINLHYHSDCRQYRTTIPSIQPSEHLAAIVDTALKSPTITSIRSRILSWLGMR